MFDRKGIEKEGIVAKGITKGTTKCIAKARKRIHARVASAVVMSWLLGTVAMTRVAWADGAPNSCGCYQDSSGACYCNKKARCGCPGSCEPKGCEQKRDKELKKEIDAETRKAQGSARHAAGSNAEKQRSQSGDDERSSGSPAHEKKPQVVRMSSAQRKELSRLLDLYVAEHVRGGGLTVDQIRGELTSGAR